MHYIVYVSVNDKMNWRGGAMQTLKKLEVVVTKRVEYKGKGCNVGANRKE